MNQHDAPTLREGCIGAGDPQVEVQVAELVRQSVRRMNMVANPLEASVVKADITPGTGRSSSSVSEQAQEVGWSELARGR